MITPSLTGFPSKFPELLTTYFAQISDAIKRNAHHDHRRALLIDFLRKSFDIEVDEIELEKKIKAAEARGRIDAFYKFVIFEIKINLDRERLDALQELKKYFESRPNPQEYVAAVTDGLSFEVYDYDSTKKSQQIRKFTIGPEDPNDVYIQLDELLAAGHKIPPTSDDIVARFGLHSMSFLRTLRHLGEAFDSVVTDSTVEVKFREWNALLAKVYGSSIGDENLFLRHTYLTILSRAIVTMVLFPGTTRNYRLFRDLLTGEFFRHRGILNLAEPDFFSWALDTVAEKPFLEVINSLFKRLEEFEWTKIDEDLLKMLYQELVDPADRSGLGEFYTPDWLAEMILQDINYESGSLLDPACGSGTFLFCAVRRLRSNGIVGENLIKHVMSLMVGLDVHPVAVLMAKANLLLALAPELRRKRDFDVQLGVYMADTLQTGEKKRKHYLAVPDGMGNEFTIPLKSVELNRDLDNIIDQLVKFAYRGAASGAVLEQARKGFMGKIKDLTVEEINLWNLNFSLMVDLVKKRRDTVWGFILKNAFRPAYLRRSKVDLIIGNPPWLSYRDIAEKAYKERIKSLVLEYDLINKGDSKLITRLDTSTLFYVHCKHEFLKEGGKIAFVMPKTVILPAKQHINFQREGFTRIHDLGAVTVVGEINQHFFNVKSCVVENTGEAHTTHVPKIVWSGKLPKKNMTLDKARHFLKQAREDHELLEAGDVKSPHYYALSIQGATLVPRTLWSVDIDDSVPLNIKLPRLKTSKYAYSATKEEKWTVRFRGSVEREFIFCTVLGEDLLPFGIRHLTMYVLPIVINGEDLRMVNHEDLLATGFEHFSDWVKRAETLWHKRSKDEMMTAQQRLNFQQLLVSQRPNEPYIVLYNRSGTNISCAYLPQKDRKIDDLGGTGFIADAVTHRMYCKSEEEAHYLVGVLNSNIVNDAIKPYQTEGVYHGKRDIYRRPFEVCAIPEFDNSNVVHLRIAALATEAEAIVGKWGPSMEGTLAKVREKARELVAKQIMEIDELVEKLLATGKSQAKTTAKASKAQVVMF
ncbi:MAG TPA: N-6 DNA methylase [Candidatus Angelobacter sp.]|nr:N-6 DNA methylase [Candidatus Angelobacter sp.]